MSISINSHTHKLSIHASEGRNPIMGKAEPKFPSNIKYFEGILLETERNARTGEIEEMRIHDINKVEFNSNIEEMTISNDGISFSVKFKQNIVRR